MVSRAHAEGAAGSLVGILMGIENLFLGFQVAITPFNLWVAVLGIVLGTIIGVLPGLGGANGVAILLPVTFTMPPTSGIILLTSIYWGALFGGAITSILFNIPGEPWSVATTFDGYPMARHGEGGQALTAAFTSSFVGAFFSIVLITLFAPVLAEVALRFGPPEFFAIQFLTFSSFVGLGGGNPLKTIVAILLGFILGAVGLDIVTGQLRMTFGFNGLMTGFDFIIAVIGLFGIGEILLTVEEGLRFEGTKTKMDPRVVLNTWKTLPAYWRTFVRSSFIGFWMGFKPGGATPASFMSYAFAKRFSKHQDRFGKGEIEGVVAPETAAHAAGVAAMLPMITLGIPGSPTAAVMLGGLIIWGLQPGPLLFTEKPDFVWGLIASMYTGNIIGVLMVLAFVPFFAAILRIPFAILTPLIIVVCAIGAYAVHNSMLDIWYMLIFGVVGYVFKKLDYPLAPLVLALVLGDMAENALRQSLIMSQGSLRIFYTSPIAATIMLFAIFIFALPIISSGWRRLRGLPLTTSAAREI
jgi:putative tricarboxylic transport membrane protein